MNNKSMKTTNSKLVKTSFEESNEICNYYLGNNYSDLSDDRTNPGTVKSRNVTTPKSEKEKHNSSKKRSSSKNKSRKNSIDLGKPSNNNLIELVDNLKEKLNIYECEMRSLIEEKVQMQIQINSLQLNSYQNLKKSGKLKKSGELTHSNDSIVEQKNIEETNNGLRNELNIMNNNLAKQRKLLDQNFSILNDSIYPDSIFKKSNHIALEIEKINCFTINRLPSNNQRISLSSFTINSSKSKNEEVLKLEQQREKMLDEINNLKNELIFLMETQMQSQHSDRSHKDKEEKYNTKTLKSTENYINTEATNSSQKKLTQEDVKIPPLQNIFLHNGKLLVLDQENYVWHLKKCRKYKKFVEINNEKFGGNKAEIFNAYFEESYESNEFLTDENQTNLNDDKQIKQSNQHMYITENYVENDENYNEPLNEEIKQDDAEKNINNKNAITPIDEFDISKMSDMSNFVYEMDKSQKELKISNKISDKKEEKDFNTSLDLSDDA